MTQPNSVEKQITCVFVFLISSGRWPALICRTVELLLWTIRKGTNRKDSITPQHANTTMKMMAEKRHNGLIVSLSKYSVLKWGNL